MTKNRWYDKRITFHRRNNYMFKQYIVTAGIITLELIGKTSCNEVDASTNVGNDQPNQSFNQHETTHNEWNSWQEFMKQFNDRYSINEQKEHGTEVKEENNDQNENVQSEEQDKDVEKQEDENDNSLHPFEQEVVDLTNQEREKQG